jgi:curli production assembly/transport component CsgE
MLRLLTASVLAAGMLPVVAYAAEPSPVQPVQAPPAPYEQLGGIVTDQTITTAGQDFYQYFSALWHDKPLSQQFAIAVRERLSARQGNRVQVEYANRTVFEGVLPAARGNVRALSERAADIAYDAVSTTEATRLLFHDPDLAADEL